MVRVKSPQDFCAGLLFLVVGALALWFGRNYAVGTVMRMGPGFLPRALSWAMIGIGAFLALRALVLNGPGIDGSLVRPQFFVIISIIVFGVLIERFGLAPAVFVVTILAALASYEMKWIEAISLAFASAVASVVLFIYVLGQSMEKWIFLIMDIFHNLAIGFGAAATPINLLFCLFGCLIGTLIGVLPGIGPIATIAMLLPVTFGLSPLGALIMLAGIYYGAQYGGSTTAILLNLPGESSSVVTCIDGYKMAQKGRAGAALAIAAIGSFFAGCVGTLLIAAFAPLLATVAEKFRSPEYFALMLFGLIAAVVLAHGSVIKAVGMIVFGLLLGLIGTESQSGVARFTFGVPELYDGVDFVPLAMGLFGFAEIMTNLDRKEGERSITAKVGSLWPNREEMRRAIPAILRGTLVGSFLGILPGGGAVLASFAAYTVEKKFARGSAEFGQGAVEGVAGPESANNAGAQTSFIPLLTLGIPSTSVMALMMGAMTIQGIAPGTAIIGDRPILFWGMIASMWIGNLMLVVINLPLIGIWVKLLSVPYRLLFPCILVLCCVGAYSISSSTFLIYLMAGFALMGYVFAKLGMEGAPFLLGFVLGPLMEENFRRSMVLSFGDPVIFVQRPISLAILLAALALLLLIILPQFRSTREVAFQE